MNNYDEHQKNFSTAEERFYKQNTPNKSPFENGYSINLAFEITFISISLYLYTCT